MMIDLHGVEPGTHHLRVDDEGLAAIRRACRQASDDVGHEGLAQIVGVPIYRRTCSCNHGDPPGVPVSLIGYFT